MPVQHASETLEWRRLWLLIGWLLVLVVVYLSLTPKPPQLGLGSDKYGHFLAYACLAGWFSQLYHGRTRYLWAAGLFLMGVSLEILQGLGQVRTYDVNDMLANGIGIVASILAAEAGLDRVLLSVERWARCS